MYKKSRQIRENVKFLKTTWQFAIIKVKIYSVSFFIYKLNKIDKYILLYIEK